MHRRGLLVLPGMALAQTGPLRVGIGVGQVGSAFWAIYGPRGVTVELALALAGAWGRALELVTFASSSEVTDALAGGGIELTFIPTDPARAARIAFGPDYYLFGSTLMVLAGAPVAALAEAAAAPGLRIVGVRGTTTLRSAERAFPGAEFLAVTGMADALRALKERRAEALALGREALDSLLPRFPGALILPGAFHQTGSAIAVPPGRPAALAAATTWMEAAKADGTVRRALDAHGIAGPVAPAGSRTGAPGDSLTGAPR